MIPDRAQVPSIPAEKFIVRGLLVAASALLLAGSRPMEVQMRGRASTPMVDSQLEVGLSAPIKAEPVMGGGGSRRSSLTDNLWFRSLWGALSSQLTKPAWALGSRWGFPLGQEEFGIDDMVSDGQFVWGPNVGEFDPARYLKDIHSPLAEYGSEVSLWAMYTSVNPMVLISTLELQHGLVTKSHTDLAREEVVDLIQTAAMDLATAFYEHLHTWGARRETAGAPQPAFPLLTTADGRTLQVAGTITSGSYAIAATLARNSAKAALTSQLSPQHAASFDSVYRELFPGLDPLDSSNSINPAQLPPDDLFQFPFPMGAVWGFNGPHSWNGGSYPPPFSSMDFFSGGALCSAPPNLYSVAAASGVGIRPSNYSCWLEISHGGGWTTSYYHLRSTHAGGSIGQNDGVGKIACEICAGGFATGPHVHFSLKYNGAYVSLEGVKLSGWTVRVGSTPYTSGSLSRGPTSLLPYSTVRNDHHLYYPRQEMSLRFYGSGFGGIDRVLVPIDSPARPADVNGDFTIEWWMKALPGDNNSPQCSPVGDGWRSGNILIDRDIANDAQGGEFGVSLAGGQIAFGVRSQAQSATLCSGKKVDDRSWHHIAVTRSVNGRMRIFIDGKLDAETVGPAGGISYPDGYKSAFPYDPYLVFGAEKHDLGGTDSSYRGWIDDVRISAAVLYSGNFQPPQSPLAASGTTVALFPFNEGPGTAAWDVSGYPGGPSNGILKPGGSPVGPEWSSVAPFGNTFTDVFGLYWAYDYIEAIAAAGLSSGYPDASYRPDNLVSRAETAVFLLRGINGAGYLPPAPDGSHTFSDIAGHWAAAWIEDLYDNSLTRGFGDGTFRPDNQLSRAELAVFLLKAANGATFAPPAPTQAHPFADIAGHWAEAWIEELWESGITVGYPDNTYRPDSSVTRAEMAVFLVRTFNLPLP